LNARSPARLTLGPLLFHWPARTRRDFYYRVADEAPVDSVYLGEVVCSKRESLFGPFLEDVAARLRAAGKEVVVSTLALVTSQREVAAIRDAAAGGALLEANDVACIQLLAGTPHIVGPYINVFNEGARDFLIDRGAIRIVLPVEMPASSVRIVASAAGPAAFEMQVFGRQPLSVATRCYHARSHNLTKDQCQLVCGLDADGLTATTVDGVEILTVNGTQTLTHGNGVLIAELDSLRAAGITYFRLSPQNLDMVRVAKLYRDVLDDELGTPDALAALRSMTGDIPFVNGFLHGRAGMCWV
jgi:O2-independent ubiquinone biosynthesis protein UbiV